MEQLSTNATSIRKLAERVFKQRPAVLNLTGRKRELPDAFRRKEREKALKQLVAVNAKRRRLDAEAREMRRDQRFTMEACRSKPIEQPIRIQLEKGVWLELEEAEYDIMQDDRLLVLRYIEGFAGCRAPYTTIAEMRAHSRGEEERRKKEGDTDGMFDSRHFPNPIIHDYTMPLSLQS